MPGRPRAGGSPRRGRRGPRAPQTRRERLRSALGWAVTAALVGVLVWFGWPSTLGGCTTLTIVSGRSMEPTYRTGDLVVSRCGTPRAGDVVVYTPPGLDRGRIIHRVVGGDAGDGWVIQGDNNDFLDPWRPHAEDVLGIARLHVPGLGRVASILLDPWAWASLLVVAAGVLLWPAPPAPPARPEPGGPAGELAPDGADATATVAP
ncbi:signal peptidase I [Cellulomonas sp. ACRRI]|uniref:signal peptidase I n=1 Tax=Cellulomonas sp. ACRRI TaxID=2918188 RepID=UPI001EF34C86|nr:signal peptidase I [Cellulomonas sp. ACRRI]MCG7287561.1 signal peptidase I [Cellulomonas sp. ACRRI]